jgi:predicted lipoprotein with Yx(FWY)xxD motif
MHRTRSRATSRRARNLAAVALAAILALSALAVPMALARGSKTVVGEAHAPSLHKTVLTNTKGLTLYSLSVEKNGKFICTGSCVAIWSPLLVAAGTTPKGPVKLGTIMRPEGKIQVTFKGLPLYTFNGVGSVKGDTAKGQANGEGFKDVGTWHAATP